MKRLLGVLKEMDWTSVTSASSATHQVLRDLVASPKLLGDLIHSLPGQPDLVELCEHYDFLDKFVLYRDPADRFRIRLHVFLETTHGERPHNHRWMYSAVVLRGSYKHTIYVTPQDAVSPSHPPCLEAVVDRDEVVGNPYTLSPSVFHAVTAKPGTVSLMIRGPAISDRFLVVETRRGRSWWEYSRDCESVEEIRRRSMPNERMIAVISDLTTSGLL